VGAASLSTRSLFDGPLRPNILDVERGVQTETARAVRWTVDGDYFATLGIPILRGRTFDRRDIPGAEPVVVVSARLAAMLWPGESPIGRRVRWHGFDGMPEIWRRVVGVVGDVQGELRRDTPGDIYEPFRQSAPQWVTIWARGAGAEPPLVLADDVRTVLGGLDPEAPFHNVVEMQSAVRSALAPSRDLAVLLTAFAGFAFLLAVLGLYGVVSYAARRSRRAVAIRMALGADASAVTGGFLRDALLVTAIGLAVGSAAGLAFAQAIAGQLHGVGPRDPWTHGGLAAALALASVVATWVPARSAARSDPASILREES
jgi:hypothetical protein